MWAVEFPIMLESLVKHWTRCYCFQEVCRCGSHVVGTLILRDSETLGVFGRTSSVIANIEVCKGGLVRFVWAVVFVAGRVKNLRRIILVDTGLLRRILFWVFVFLVRSVLGALISRL